jgi:hypothetical protein
LAKPRIIEIVSGVQIDRFDSNDIKANAEGWNVSTKTIALCAAAISLGSAFWLYLEGCLLYYGDAESHLNHARRVLDSLTPGVEQLGTVWLPLPHLLMLPFVANDTLWRTGLAGAIPSSIAFLAATTFLFGATRRLTDSSGIGAAAAAVFALNPNMLYLQAVPMSEPVFLMALLGLFYFLVRFQRSQSIISVAGAGGMALAATLTRFEGWLLLPLAAVVLVATARSRREWIASVFLAIAAIGPLAWLAYNWWVSGNALEFYNGPYSPQAIQGGIPYPGQGNWPLAVLYLISAGKLTSGAPLFWLGCAGCIVMISKRVVWPVALLAAPPLLVICSIHSGGTPIQLPGMPYPESWYNTRYGVSLLPLFAFSVAVMTIWVAPQLRRVALWLVTLAVIAPWVVKHSPESWVIWKEAEINSEARRAWTGEAARYLKKHFRPGDTIFTGSGDVNGIFREAGIPLVRTLSVDNGLFWDAARLRPDLFLRCQWAVAVLTPKGRSDGDQVKTAVELSRQVGRPYELVREIQSADGKVVEIYHRAEVSGVRAGTSNRHEM